MKEKDKKRIINLIDELLDIIEENDKDNYSLEFENERDYIKDLLFKEIKK
jgi:hypothetical protein